ncbi:unnamed protein product [Hermetia illucens]|uniref:Metalloendopeptidase n=1 Tax=Hermetia illucens TaxID=343691 RepID=A0A7R8UY97_HERIL|nr:unnamed protein product [Hermetia illucens]
MLENLLVVMRSVILLILISLNISREFPLDDYIYLDDLDSSLHDDIIFEDYKEDLYQDSEKKVQIRSVIKDPVYRWKDGIIYYYIDEVFTTIQRAHIIQQMEEIANVTCLQFKPKTKTSSDYVHIMGRSNGCHSQVGRRGGRQVLNLKPSALNTGCFRKGVVKHEMMHTIGFYHEHNAPDRDDYITINWENIQDDKIICLITEGESSARMVFIRLHPGIRMLLLDKEID